MMDMNKNVFIFSYILLLCGAFLLFNLSIINEEAIWGDEFHTIIAISGSYQDLMGYLIKDVHPPVYFTILQAWTSIVGLSIFTLRLFSLFFATISLILAWHITRRIFSKRTALISTLILATSGTLVTYALEARMYTFLLFLFLLQLNFFISYFRDQKMRDLVFCSITTILLLYTHVTAILPWFTLNLIMWMSAKKKQAWWLSQSMLILLYIPWLLIFSKQMAIHYAGYIFFLNRGSFHLIPWDRILTQQGMIIFFPTALILFVFLHKKLRKLSQLVYDTIAKSWLRQPDWFLVFLIVFLIFFHKFFPHVFFSSHPIIRYTIYALPIALVILTDRILQCRAKTFQIMLITIILILQITALWDNSHQSNRFDWVSAAEYVSNHTENPVIGFEIGSTSYDIFLYYQNKLGTSYEQFRIGDSMFPTISQNREEYRTPQEFVLENQNRTKILIITKLFGKPSKTKALLPSPTKEKYFKDIEVLTYS